MPLKITQDSSGTVWISNPPGSTNKALGRTPFRILMMGPVLWLMVWAVLAVAGVGQLAFNPVTLIFVAVILAIYLAAPKPEDPTIPLRLGFSREALLVEKLGGDTQTIPWATITGASVGQGALLGARL